MQDVDPAPATRVCSSCGLLNAASCDYCSACGTPLLNMAENTQVKDAALSPVTKTRWRVYGVETDIFGRDDDLAVLARALHSAVSQQSAQLLLLHGPEGIGKTRLVSAFNTQLHQHNDDAHLVSAACRILGGPPYAVLGRLIKGRFYIPEKAPPELARQKLLEGIRATMRNPLADEVTHMVGYLIGLPFPDSPLYARFNNDPGRLVERARGALRNLLERDAQRGPLVFVLEDTHLADDETLELLRYLHEHLSTSPLLFICLAQPELAQRAPWLFEPGSRRHAHRLGALSDEDVRALTSDILRRVSKIPEALHDVVQAHAFGNPMSVEGIIRVLIDQGAIDTRGNTWTINGARLPEIELPNSIAGIVRARLDGLTHTERNILERAALIGQTFWAEGIQLLERLHHQRVPEDSAVWPGQSSEDRVLELLKVLHRKDMIRRRQSDSLLPDQREFVFKHHIERQIIYENIDPELRKRYHLLVAQWLGAVTNAAGLRERFLEEIGHHYEQGLHLSHAAKAYIEAGRLAAEQYRNQSAVHLFERALAFLGERDLPHHTEVLMDLGAVLELTGEPERALDFHEELLQAAWLLGDRNKLADAYNRLGRSHRTLGNFDRALNNLNRALALFEHTGNPQGESAVLADIGMVHFVCGAYKEAQSCYQRSLELQQQEGDPVAEALTLNRLGSVKLRSGHTKEALVLFRQALDLRRNSDDRRGVAESLNNLAVLCQERGDLAQAEALFQEAQTIAQEIGDRIMLVITQNNAAEIHLERGQHQSAQTLLEDTIALTREIGERRVHFHALCNLSRAQLGQGRLTAALKTAAQARRMAEQLDAPVLVALALHAQGDIHAEAVHQRLSGDHMVQAEDAFRQSIKLLTDIGDEAELGRVLSAYGEFLMRQGLSIQGRKRLEMAKSIFSRLEMRRVLQDTESTMTVLE